MRVLALNSSARAGTNSKTELLLDALVDGMREAAADVDVVRLKDYKIKDCQGCFACWTQTPGVCIQKDDMTRELFGRWREADLAVYATPLFHHTVNAIMKRFIERTLPAIEPFMETDGRHWSHPLRGRLPDAVVLSVCGFPDQSAFEALSHYVRYTFASDDEERGWRLRAEIYRSAAETLGVRPEFKDQVLGAVRRAGTELIADGRVHSETMTEITRPLPFEPDTLKEAANCFWRTCIDEGLTMKQFADRDLTPRPDSMASFLSFLIVGFNPRKAGDQKATVEFDFSGSVTGRAHFVVDGGAIQARPGPAVAPDLTIHTPFEVWADVMSGKVDGQQAFMDGLYTVDGDVELLMRFDRFFGADDEPE